MGKASINGAKFGAILNTKFSDRDYANRKLVAAELDIGPSTLGEYVRLERNFPPDLIADLVRATGDLDYIRFFTSPLGLGIHRLPIGKADADQTTLLKRMGEAMKRFSALTEQVGEAISADSDGGTTVTPAEHREIASAYQLAVEAMAAVVAITSAASGGSDETVSL